MHNSSFLLTNLSSFENDSRKEGFEWLVEPAIRERSINRRHVYTERDLSIAGMYIQSRQHLTRTTLRVAAMHE